MKTAVPIITVSAARTVPPPPTGAAMRSPSLTPHFVSAPEATPLRPVKKAAPAQPAAKAAPAVNNAKSEQGSGQNRRNAQPNGQNGQSRPARGSRNERTERNGDRAARPAQNSAQSGKPRSERSSQPARAPRAPKQETSRGRGRVAAPSRDEDPGLVLISRRPPQQKFTNFEEYMNAHGGATAPIEDHNDEM